MTSNYKVSCIKLCFIVLLACMEINAFSFAINRSYRNSGRETRAPFKNPDIMVARGFGKRDVANARNSEIVAKNDLIVNDVNWQDPDAISIDFFAKELKANPTFTRAILRRFVDANKDDMISPRELLGSSTYDSNTELY